MSELTEKKEADHKLSWLRGVVKDIVVIGGFLVVFQTFAFAQRYIPSSSMEPTLQIGDRIIVSKYNYGFSRYSFPFDFPPFEGRVFGSLPERGEIVVFSPPEEGAEDFIKRVIGLPGDRIALKGGRLYINGEIVPRKLVEQRMLRSNGWPQLVQFYEEELPGGKTHMIAEWGDNQPYDTMPEVLVPEGHLFMMGDNRDNSRDSRARSGFGFVAAEELVGPARVTSLSFAACDERGGDSCFLGLPLGRFFKALD